MLTGLTTIENTMVLAQIDSMFRQQLGDNLNADGSYDDGGTAKPFALAYLQQCDDETGGQYYKLKTFYSMTASMPSSEDTTRTDSVEPNEYEITATGAVSSFVTSPTTGQGVSSAEWYVPKGLPFDAIAKLLRTTLPVPGVSLEIEDTLAPVIGQPLVNPVLHKAGAKQSFDSLMRSAGISVIDNVDGDITHLATIIDEFGANLTPKDKLPDLEVGTSTKYTISAEDSAGNKAEDVEFIVEEIEES